MVGSLNKVILIGVVGREPEMRFTPQGKPVTTFGLGTCGSEGASEGAETDAEEWFNVVAWGSLAELCVEELGTGQRAYVEGRLQMRDWIDTQGDRCVRVDVVASEVIVLDASPQERAGYGAREAPLDASRGEDDPPYS
jgi:single-strand DNA-binding protein